MTYGHLRADCLYTGISSGPNACIEYGKAFTFTLLVQHCNASTAARCKNRQSPNRFFGEVGGAYEYLCRARAVQDVIPIHPRC